MSTSYPDHEGFAYSFQRAELSCGVSIYVAISNVSFDQPTTEGVVHGTRPYPLMSTEGEMGIGEGSITFSGVGEWARFLEDLGDGWRSKRWSLKWVLTSPGKTAIRKACQGCRVLSNPVDHSGGEEALGGEINFSALSHTVNGKSPHRGMVSPTR